LRKWFDCVPDNGKQVVGGPICVCNAHFSGPVSLPFLLVFPRRYSAGFRGISEESFITIQNFNLNVIMNVI